ncbi:MAG TPA: amino acid adenylation domain-containing protein, partial [Clostridia bacterium]
MGDFKKENVKDIYLLSPMQQGMLFHTLLNSKDGTYFEQLSFDICGKLDIDHLEQSFNKLIERHDALRTNFVYEKTKNPVQVVFREKTSKIHYEDISFRTDKAAVIEEIMRKDKENGFDLTRDNLIRMTVLKVNHDNYKVFISFHHIIIDGWCIGVILEEMFKIYEAVNGGKPLDLPDAYPYSGYIKWLDKQNFEEASQYWKGYLEGYEELSTLPKCNNKNVEENYDHEEVRFNIDGSLLSLAERTAANNNVTLNTLLQAVWGILLQKYNNTDDVAFGTVLSGRTPQIAGVERMLGLLINTVPVRVKTSKDESFADLINKIQKNMLECEKYGHYPLYETQSGLQLKQGLLDHVFIFENYPLEKYISMFGENHSLGFNINNLNLSEKTNYDFNIELIPGEGLEIKIIYNKMVYAKYTIDSLYTHFFEILKAVTQNPDVLIKDIDILPSEEKEQLSKFNLTKSDYPFDKTIAELFEQQVQKTPGEKAVIFGEKHLTYSELNERANQLAAMLTAKGVKRDVIVGVMTGRSIEMMIGILGVLKAGGAYLPIDPDYPKDRILYMLEDSKAGILLTQGDSANAVGFFGEIINLESREAYHTESTNPNLKITSDSLAYVIYTSGSTGRPKGVMLEHRSVCNFIKGITDIIDFSCGKAIACVTTLSFDIFVLETLLPLTKGLSVVIADEREQMEPCALRKVVVKNNVKMMQTTPSRMQMILNDTDSLDFLKDLSEIMIGGEAFPETLLTELKKHTNARIYNMYGPTETTVWSTVKELTSENKITIGRPIANTEIYIMNKDKGLQPIGVAGELYIGGDGLARGYLNSPELTKEKFVQNPFEAGKRIYRTGDLGKWLPDGNIECLGRADSQVKIRGYRIELGEIEHHLSNHESINEAVVVAEPDNNNMNCLYAYYVAKKDVTAAELRKYLLTLLPEYMVPSFFLKLDKLPVTPNGKIDRKSLPRQDIVLVSDMLYERPTNELEDKIAGIWAEVLGVDKVGINNRFIELGGHSILMMKAIARINKDADTSVTLKEFTQNDTVKGLSNLISEKQNKDKNLIYKTCASGKENIYEPFPLTDVQTAYLLGRDTQFELGGISTHGYVEIRTKLDIRKLNLSLQKVINRHPMLRSIILNDGSQKILEKTPEYIIEIEDISEMQDIEQENRLLKERERMSQYIFNPEKWPLFDFKAYKLSEDTHYLYIGI